MNPAVLAIDGGNPVRARLLPYGHQLIGEEDIAAVTRVLRSDWLTTGPAIALFERDFAAAVGGAHAVAVSSGTAALHAAAHAVGIGPGDEVIVPALTFVASANCVRYMGGTVVFADVRPDTLTVDPSAVRALVTPRTKAILGVDFTGQPCDIDELAGLAHDRAAFFIEDAAHAVGATYRSGRVGALADVSIFSLHPVKQLTTGEGGVALTEDPLLAKRMTTFRNHGITTDAHQREATGSWSYDMVELGYNYRLTDIQAALGSAQIPRLGGWLERRRAIALRYMRELLDVPELELPVLLPDRASGWHLFIVRLNLDRLRVDRATVFRALRAENIGVNVHYIPVPWHTYYQRLGYVKGGWPVAEDAYERMVTLPLWPGMSDDDVADVVLAVRKVCGAYRR